MRYVSFSGKVADELVIRLIESGYSRYELKKYMRYSKKRGDSVFIHHSFDILRCYKGTEANKIIRMFLGVPNGIASECEDTQKDSWFLNDYRGRGATKLD